MSEAKPGGGEGERPAIEVRARTVDEAVARGLVRLGGMSRTEVRIEVLSEGRTGLLGFGSEEAVVRLTPLRPGETAVASSPAVVAPEPPAVTVAVRQESPRVAAAPVSPPPPPPPPLVPPVAVAAVGEPEADRAVEARPDPSQSAAVAIEVTRQMLTLLGFEDVTVEAGAGLLPLDVDDSESLVLAIKGTGTERLLAAEAEALNALQFLVRLVVSRRLDGWVSVLLDVNGDRARRVTELLQLAEQSANLVEREGRPVALPPMSAYERRVVHLALRNHPAVVTQSIGSGDYRKVTVRLQDQLLPEL